MDYEKIGIFIATKRKKIGLTQKELAHKLNITDKAVSKWERGLGCPDVSILEDLSKILGVSILDILNGEDVVEEFIDTNNVKLSIESVVDDAKKQNDKLKSIISKFLIGIILSVALLIIILNVLNIKKLNKKLYFDETTTYFGDISTSIEKLNNNMLIVRNSQGIYSTEEYNIILDSLKEIEVIINNLKLFNYCKDKTYLTDLDLSLIGGEWGQVGTQVPIVNLYHVLKNYNNNFDDLFNIYNVVFIIDVLSSDTVYYPVSSIYYDINSGVYEIDMINGNIGNGNKYKNDVIMVRYLYTLEIYNYLVNLIMEVGEINA